MFVPGILKLLPMVYLKIKSVYMQFMVAENGHIHLQRASNGKDF